MPIGSIRSHIDLALDDRLTGCRLTLARLVGLATVARRGITSQERYMYVTVC